jgi:glycosyltransferase involved in cell wall biosynthesis
MTPRMAVVTTAHPWGDPRVFERSLATCLAWGVETHVFVPLAEPPRRSGWSADPRLTVHALPMPRGRRARVALALGAWRELLRHGPWQLVHFHDPELMPAMALLGILSPDTYTLCDIHEDLPLQVASKGYLPEWTRLPLARLIEFMDQMARGLFTGFAPATEAIARAWPPAQTRVVHNYPKAVFAGEDGAVSRLDPHRVLYVGGLSRARGLLVALEAVALARRQRPLRLELVGWVMEAEVGAAIERAVAQGWCLHIPWLAPEALAGHAAGAGIGLVTLLPLPNYLESLPTKLFEYMAMGIPVLASDFPLWRQLVGASGAGRVTAPEALPLAQALVEMSGDPAALATYSEQGRRAYRERYRWEREARNLRWHLQQAGLALST